ncbi:hypothetical protein Glove_187g43 [Diversispora epigaea]|uniref:histidine--tRNA ligase n=1 Tax=Diversispora epigaea TaxID=1348612 RepID=A0A397IVC6_9GLOM|nr:hypothetical protein Glove_187g43 [Diversispora epigaea]
MATDNQKKMFIIRSFSRRFENFEKIKKIKLIIVPATAIIKRSIIEPARPVKGTHDRFDNDLVKLDYIRKIGSSIAELHCFEQISTPILEFSQVFERTLGSDSDIVGKELYRFKDKEDDLTLRPEGTAGIVRSLISNSLDQELPRKYYYHGSMFRHEKPQRGRLRQFEQFGVEMFGHDNPTSDIELIDMAMTFLNKIGLNDKVVLEINSLADMESRTRYKEVVRDYLRLHETQLSEDSLNRISTNPLRVLDSKHHQDQLIIKNCPPISEYYNSASTKRFETVCQGLDKLDIPHKINPRLVRGLDYYENTIFEFKYLNLDSKLGHSQGTILAGGRYDGLVQLMGGKYRVPGIGWAAGIDRLALILDESCIQPKTRPVAIIVIHDREEQQLHQQQQLEFYALKISKSLLSHNIKTLFYHLPSSFSTTSSLSTINNNNNTTTTTITSNTNKKKSSLKYILGNILKSNASHAILIGEEEFKQSQVTIKFLDLKIQRGINVEDIIDTIEKNQN